MNIVDDKDFDTLFTKTMEAGSRLVTMALMGLAALKSTNKDVGPVHAINLSTAAVAGCMESAAHMVTIGNAKPTQDHFLFIGILTALCQSPSEDGIQFDYNVGTVVDTLDFIERATGRRIDHVLIPDMVEAARMVQKTGSDVLKDFMEARAASQKPAA